MRKKCYHLGAYNTVNQAIIKKANLERHTMMQQLLKELNETYKPTDDFTEETNNIKEYNSIQEDKDNKKENKADIINNPLQEFEDILLSGTPF